MATDRQAMVSIDRKKPPNISAIASSNVGSRITAVTASISMAVPKQGAKKQIAATHTTRPTIAHRQSCVGVVAGSG